MNIQMLAPVAYVVRDKTTPGTFQSKAAFWKDVMTTKRALLRMRTRPSCKMKSGYYLLVILVAVGAISFSEGKGGLQIGVKKRPEVCEMRSKKGERLSMHYVVSSAGGK